LLSPFMRGQGERPLKITFHISSLANATGETLAALQTLRELGYVAEITAYQTEPGDFPHIVIGDNNVNFQDNTIPVRLIVNGEAQLYTGIIFPRHLPQLAGLLAKETNIDTKTILEDLLVAEAHIQVGGDIFITSSNLLLKHRHKEFIGNANPREPEEAAQIVGLFLRTHDIYTYSAGKNYKLNCDRGGFYWILARHRLPSMWRYFSGCLHAGQIVGDYLQELGESILIRAVRALEARDAIGTMFYMPQNNNIRDQIMYHFDYLTLVLAGALDAQARIARRAYHVEGEERYASFRDKKFRQTLERKGALELMNVINDPQFDSYLLLLYRLRNTIHGPAMKAIAYQSSGDPEITLVEVPKNIQPVLWANAEQCGTPEEWGLKREFPGMMLEPYSYATNLVKFGLSTLDKIAAATDVTRLFPAGSQIPTLTEAEPNDQIWRWASRISLLG